MLLSGRRLLLGLSIVIVACGIVVAVFPAARWLSVVVAACGLLIALGLGAFRSPGAIGEDEADDICDVSPQRRAELIRGTSKFLREMRYRYSVRMDSSATRSDCFCAEVNSVRLGFVPALITDNTTDRQGHGYVAFVYDQKRWRGPGLPCPAGQSEAVQHAARCVSPLANDDEAKF